VLLDGFGVRGWITRLWTCGWIGANDLSFVGFKWLGLAREKLVHVVTRPFFVFPYAVTRLFILECEL